MWLGNFDHRHLRGLKMTATLTEQVTSGLSQFSMRPGYTRCPLAVNAHRVDQAQFLVEAFAADEEL